MNAICILVVFFVLFLFLYYSPRGQNKRGCKTIEELKQNQNQNQNQKRQEQVRQSISKERKQIDRVRLSIRNYLAFIISISSIKHIQRTENRESRIENQKPRGGSKFFIYYVIFIRTHAVGWCKKESFFTIFRIQYSAECNTFMFK